MRKNILVINFKGGASKSTNSSILASFLNDSRLIEIDKINQSDERIDSGGYYKSFQLDFKNETSESFFQFEDMLLEEGIKIIDVGAVKLEAFHSAMIAQNLYPIIDLFIIPAMDGEDDYQVAFSFLESIKNELPDLQNRVLFSFNRYNPNEYDSVSEQFDSFFDAQSDIKKAYGIDLAKNYFTIKDSRSIKYSRKTGVTLRSLVEEDIDELTARQRAETDAEKRKVLTKKRALVLNAQNLYRDYIVPAMTKVTSKLGA